MLSRLWLFIGCLSAAISVAMGAVGAHAWRNVLEANHRMPNFQTAVLYQMIHSLGLVLFGLWCRSSPNPVAKCWTIAVGICFLLGIVFFSGSLYGLALTNNTAWAAAAPFGGTAYIVGWLIWSVAVLRNPNV